MDLTYRQREDFVDALQLRPDAERTLQLAIKWLAENAEPNDVFDESKLKEHVARTWQPSEVFPDRELQEWAEDNDYVKAEDAT